MMPARPAQRDLRADAPGDHAGGGLGELAAVVVAPEVFDAQAVALEEQVQLAGEDAGHVEDELLAAGPAEGVEPLVAGGDLDPLPGHVAPDVVAAEDRAVELGDVEDVAVEAVLALAGEHRVVGVE